MTASAIAPILVAFGSLVLVFKRVLPAVRREGRKLTR